MCKLNCTKCSREGAGSGDAFRSGLCPDCFMAVDKYAKDEARLACEGVEGPAKKLAQWAAQKVYAEANQRMEQVQLTEDGKIEFLEFVNEEVLGLFDNVYKGIKEIISDAEYTKAFEKASKKMG